MGRAQLWLQSALLLWLSFVQSSNVHPLHQQMQYYRPPSARMMTHEEAQQQMQQMQQMQRTVQPQPRVAAASTMQQQQHEPRQQQPIQPTHSIHNNKAGDSREQKQDDQKQTMQSYLKSLGISDPSVAALLSDEAVDDIASSIESAVQGGHHHDSHPPAPPPPPPPSLLPSSSSILRPGDLAVHRFDIESDGPSGDKQESARNSDTRLPRQEFRTTQTTAQGSGAVDSGDDGDDVDDYREEVDVANIPVEDDDVEDDDPTYRVPPPEDPISDEPSPQLREPISEWLEKFWEQRRAYKLSSMEMEKHGQRTTHDRHLTPATHQHLHPSYGQPHHHPHHHLHPHQQLPGQRGSQINVYGQLHIHVGNQQHEQQHDGRS